MKMWTEVRRSVLTEKMSKRKACKKYKIHWDTLEKILADPEPPKKRGNTDRKKPVLGPYLPVIHAILKADRDAPKKQRHTAKRIFERLRDEEGYRISYDNSKIAVARIVGRRGDTPTEGLLRLESHYLFNHHFCLVRRPNEKGHTKNLVGFARRNFMVPIPKFDDFEQFNEALAEVCLKDLERKLRGTAGTKRELLVKDRFAMFPLPSTSFEARRTETRTANSLSLVRFDRNDYSVPTAYAYHPVN